MIYSSSGRRAYGIKSFIFDTYDDMLQEKNTNTGDTAFIIDTSKYYMLNHKKEWIEIFPTGITNGGEDPSQHIVYDGGVVQM